MRLMVALMWASVAMLCLLLTSGNIDLVRFQQTAESSIRDADLDEDVYASSALPQATRFFSECLSEVLLTRKDLQLKQLDLLYGHEALDQTQRKLEQAHAFLLDFVHCNPGNGSAWLAAAMVMNTMNNDADVTMQYLVLSKFYSPNDKKAISSRAAILQNVSQRLKNEYRDLLIDTGVPPISYDRSASLILP